MAVRARYGLLFPRSSSLAAIDAVQVALEARGLVVVRETIAGETSPVATSYLAKHHAMALTVTCSHARLEAHAERLGLFKPLADSPCARREPFVVARGDTFAHYAEKDGPHRFFSSSEELYVLGDLLDDGVEGHHVEMLPLHDKHEKSVLWRDFCWSLYPSNTDLADRMEAYFGSQVALYFAWLHYLTIFLAGPGVLGGLLTLYEYLADVDESDDVAVSPFFTLFMVLWSACFLQYWQRRSAALACRWGLLEAATKRTLRPDFVGVPHTNTFSGVVSLTYPYYYRAFKYIWSALVTTSLLSMAVGIMVISLNFQGYIHAKSVGGAYLHWPLVHQFSLPGAVFDQQGGGPLPYVLPYVPVVLHCSLILLLNLRYRKIAYALTQYENHATTESFENALVLKRFFFEAFDCYIALFYLAFCQLDVVLLKAELTSLYMADTFRRVGLETLLPLALKYVGTRPRDAKTKKDDEAATSAKVQVVKEATAFDEYEPFDDYLEKVIEFGYVTLFASCFPLAGLLSMASNLIELKSDQFKLIFLTQRPAIARCTTIGIWQSILGGLVWLSVLTNVFLFGFTTDQLSLFCPSWFQTIPVEDAAFGGVDHIHVAASGQGMTVMGFVFGVEHVLFVLVFLITKLIPSVPDSVIEETARRQRALVLAKPASSAESG
ncbi:hypothetical protein SDRG_12781 [Saprolegnia diclina VS20]|uniref:Anoctamin transmembrane domain-containing protein n=1 Tax=Saprolegnia diclina (strain VS20) TaxID=1156394 RepID=T0RI98_SAPDV|nr:hypothetical protein SDRG_12781 [Saprolegnia diclina VS20]EQC29532.1 hypothetical protein SDRG_12781 [Saprolegnia diclina VS20]|eukprot:XP_008617084.1 hypothetical protein SDRG_12781 [Saprolegnia diclina VS20]